MALVAYSDDSDLGSDAEEEEEETRGGGTVTSTVAPSLTIHNSATTLTDKNSASVQNKPICDTRQNRLLIEGGGRREGVSSITDKIKNSASVQNKPTGDTRQNRSLTEKEEGGGGGINSIADEDEANASANIQSGVDSIVDEDEDEARIAPSSGLFSSVPAPVSVSSLLGAGTGLQEEEEEEVLDVPTVDTWKVTQELKKQTAAAAAANGTQVPHSTTTTTTTTTTQQPQPPRKERKKVKILLPSLSEFADDEEEEEEEAKAPLRKRAKASSSGSGLFAVLPEPKHQSAKEAGHSLVPHILTKRPSQPPQHKKKPPKPPKPAPTAVAVADASDEEEEEPISAGTDFFSLSEPSVVEPMRTAEVSVPDKVTPAVVAPSVEPIKEVLRVPDNLYVPLEQDYQNYVEEGPSRMNPDASQLAEATAVPQAGGIDEATLLRLAGKRGRAEAISFIDVNADDALLTRQEWMTKALSEEKPQHGFSKKREGLPTQKQKQKHQITYLAHQAKERELDLKNSWAQNKMTKMQSQAKYGF